MAYNLLFWVFGAAHSLSWDYLPGVPQGEEAERRLTWKEKPLGSLITRRILRQPSLMKRTSSPRPSAQSTDDLDEKEKAEAISVVPREPLVEESGEMDPEVQLVRRMSRLSTMSTRVRHEPELSLPPASLVLPALESTSETATVTAPGHVKPRVPSIIKRSLRPLAALVTPTPISIIISLPIALIRPLKALFVDVSSSGGPDWKGPDGKPPLSFMIDTGTLHSWLLHTQL